MRREIDEITVFRVTFRHPSPPSLPGHSPPYPCLRLSPIRWHTPSETAVPAEAASDRHTRLLPGASRVAAPICHLQEAPMTTSDTFYTSSGSSPPLGTEDPTASAPAPELLPLPPELVEDLA